MSLRDHLGDLRWRLANGRVHASNAWHRAAGRRIHGARTRVSNWRNRRTLERGRASRLTGAGAAVSSRLPVYRSRVNPATGRRHRDDARLHRAGNEGLARMKETRARDRRYGPMVEAARIRERPAVRPPSARPRTRSIR